MTDDAHCLFCKILRREIPAKVVFENDFALAFRDLHPVAPTHVLVVPKKHIVGIAHAELEDAEAMGHLLLAARKVAEQDGLGDGGYRLVINNGADAGQSVFHLHVHVIGGRGLSWPPG